MTTQQGPAVAPHQQRRDQISMMFWGGFVVSVLSGLLTVVAWGIPLVRIGGLMVFVAAAFAMLLGGVAWATRLGFESLEPGTRGWRD